MHLQNIKNVWRFLLEKSIDWKKYSPYFVPSEFDCKCGCGKNNMTETQMDMLLQARILANIPFVINSGTRCLKHNTASRGSVDSEHLYGEGTDINCTSSTARWKIIDSLIAAGFNRIGIDEKFIHAGSRIEKPQNVIWVY